jgi:hypothetical protein
MMKSILKDSRFQWCGANRPEQFEFSARRRGVSGRSVYVHT